jgi:hypothetical protein
LRNYDKVSDAFKQKKKEKEKRYLENPKKCLHCDNIIPYDFRDNNHCNHSCFASESNIKRKVTWGDKISKSIHEYLIKNGIKEEGKVGVYDINCKGCGIIFQKNRNDLSYCSIECRKNFRRRNMDEYQKYRLDSNFNFNLSDYPDEFDFSLIEKYGWYSPTNKKNNLNGVSRDHMFLLLKFFLHSIEQ